MLAKILTWGSFVLPIATQVSPAFKSMKELFMYLYYVVAWLQSFEL